MEVSVPTAAKLDVAPPARLKPHRSDATRLSANAILFTARNEGAPIEVAYGVGRPNREARDAGCKTLLDALLWDARSRGATGLSLRHEPDRGNGGLSHVAALETPDVFYEADGWQEQVALGRVWLYAYAREALDRQEAKERPESEVQFPRHWWRQGEPEAPTLDPNGEGGRLDGHAERGRRYPVLREYAIEFLAKHGTPYRTEDIHDPVEQAELLIASGSLPHEEWVQRAGDIMGVPWDGLGKVPLWTSLGRLRSKERSAGRRRRR